MSKYTTEVRWVVEQTLDELNLENTEANWPKCWKVLGLDDYPLFAEQHRDVLNSKIVRHFYTREIGSETVGRWRMFVRDAMHRIMPYYNQLYESEAKAAELEFYKDRFLTTTEHSQGTSNSESSSRSDSSSENSSSSTNQSVFSDTPNSEMIPDQIKAMKYASNVTIDTSSGNATASGNSTTSGNGSGNYDNDFKRVEEGFMTSQADLIKKARETFLNIDEQVVQDKELRDCFMTVW